MKPKTHPRHRHFIAAPVMVLALLAVAFLDHTVPVSASFARAGGESRLSSEMKEQEFSSPGGVAGVLAPGSDLVIMDPGTSLRLVRGSLLVHANGFVTVDSGFGVAAMLQGSMLLLRDARSATVVALESPVMVTQAGRTWIVPEGYQMRLSDWAVQRLTIPQEWFRDQLARTHTLPASPLPALTEEQQSVFDTFSLSGAVLPSLNDADRTALLHSLMHSEDALTQDQAETALDLISGHSDSSLWILLALRLSIEPDLLTPDAAVIFSDVLSNESSLSSELPFAIPAQAASTIKPLSSSLITAWTKVTIRAGVGDAKEVALTLHAVLPGLSARYEDSGYPLQAMLWREAVREVRDVLTPLLTGTAREQFAADTASALRSDFVTATGVVSSSVSSTATMEAPLYSSEQVLALARQMLVTRGVLFTGATTIEMSDNLPHCANVSQVFIAENGQDVPYSFVYCPADETVRDIERDGVRQPNSLGADKFFGQ